MSKIRIKNFGPIKGGFTENGGFMDIKKVTVFIGNQGSGKSTVAKLISTFTWIEKALVRGDYNKKWFERKNKLKNQYLPYHRIENYLRTTNIANLDIGVVNLIETTEIEYNGDAYDITYANASLTITEKRNSSYPLPQIMYVPAERNFIANVKTPKALKLTSDSLAEFVTEFDNAKDEMKGPIKLPINEAEVEYDKLNDVVNIKSRDYKVRLTDASSGFQSLVPLFLVSRFLSNAVKHQSEIAKEPMSGDELERFRKGVEDIWSNETLTNEQRRIALSVLSSKFTKTAFINIVEEPEQNLFPSSQHEMLNSLLKCNNINDSNKLIMTTHSPYLINYLTLAVKAHWLKERIKTFELMDQLAGIVPLTSTVGAEDLVIYELDMTGGINKLAAYEGLPSDENYLNKKLSESNEFFAQLLEIQQAL